MSKSEKTAHDAASPTVSTGHSIAALLPIMAVVSIAFLIIGFALPVLPLHVHHGLGLSTFVVGLVTGSQFCAALISRVWSGRYADRRGAKRAVVAGLLAAVVAGLLYLVSLGLTATPVLSVTILLGVPRASSSPVRPPGDWRSPARKTPDASSPGWGWRCSPPWRLALQSVPRFTLSGALPPSRSRPRSFLSSRCCSSRLCLPSLRRAVPRSDTSRWRAPSGCLGWARPSAASVSAR